MTTGKTKAWTKWTFVGKVMSLLFNIAKMGTQISWYFEYQRNCELTVSLVIMKQDIL